VCAAESQREREDETKSARNTEGNVEIAREMSLYLVCRAGAWARWESKALSRPRATQRGLNEYNSLRIVLLLK